MGKLHRRINVKVAAKKVKAKAALNGSANGSATVKVKRAVSKGGSKGRPRHGSIILPEGYRPSEGEPFMSERHKVYFRNKLVDWKEEIVRQNRETLHILHEDSGPARRSRRSRHLRDRSGARAQSPRSPAQADRQDRCRAARIQEGTYGFCEETGEPIGLKRLEARPIATLSLEAQERHERREKVFRED